MRSNLNGLFGSLNTLRAAERSLGLAVAFNVCTVTGLSAIGQFYLYGSVLQVII